METLDADEPEQPGGSSDPTLSSRPPPLVPQHMTGDDAWGLTPQDREACQAAMRTLRAEGIFTPPSVQGSVAFPGNVGGMNWSSGAFEPERQVFVTNVNNLAIQIHLIPRAEYQAKEQAAKQGQFRAEVSPQHGTPYGMSRQVLRAPPSGPPCNPPPWGSLIAVDLSAGIIKWSVPLGTSEDLLPGVSPMLRGMPKLGGPIVTAAHGPERGKRQAAATAQMGGPGVSAHDVEA